MRAWPEVLLWWAFLVLVYLATLNSFSYAELIVSIVLAVPCAMAARAGRHAAGARWSMRAGWLRWLRALPWAVAHDTVAMLALTARPDRPDEDRFDEVELAGSNARAGWEAAATTVLSSTPGSVVVEGSDEHDRLVVHTVPIPATSLREAVRR